MGVKDEVLHGWREALREQLATLAHARWAHWTAHMLTRGTFTPHDECVLPEEDVTRWKRQIATPFAELPEEEKASDYVEADKILSLLGQRLQELGRKT
jgi:hypothetical protein